MSAKRRGRPAGAAPSVSPCEPVGLLSAPTPPEPVRCRCGATLYARASADRHEWVWVTETGELYRDDRPEGLRRDPARWWADLVAEHGPDDECTVCLSLPAEADPPIGRRHDHINYYSILGAALDLGFWPWFHAHRPEPEWSPIDADDAADIIDAGLAAARAGEPGAVPWCHGWPMRQAPDGWECRQTKRLFPYRKD